ncbi:MAG: hypothetical protein VCC99_03265 [Alphaproteobacteria bacterium]
MTAAGVDRRGDRTDAYAAMIGIMTAHDSDESFVRLGDVVEASGAPPETIGLRGKWAGGVDAGMDQQDIAGLSQRGAAHARQKCFMAGMRADGFTQYQRPPGQCQRSLAAAHPRDVGAQSVGLHGRADALGEHPFKNLRRILRDLNLRELLPHFFLASAQKDDVVLEKAEAGHESTAKHQDFIDRLDYSRPAAKEIAKVDQAVAELEPGLDFTVEGREFFALAMNGANRPNAARALNESESHPIIVGHQRLPRTAVVVLEQVIS